MTDKFKKAGIYKLICKENGKIYVGKSINIRRRLERHRYSSTDNGNSILKRAIIKYGWDNFEAEVLETFDSFEKGDKVQNTEILKRESYYIELYDSTNPDKGYNYCKYSTDRTGIPCSAETKLKISQSNLGKKKHTPESKEKIRQANLGRPLSKEHKEKLRKARLGMRLSEEVKDEMRKRGKKLSEEHKYKIGQAGIGRKMSKENLEKMKIRNKGLNLGRKHSEEERLKMRLAKLGKPRSEETKEKIRQTRARNKEMKLTESQIGC